MTIIAHAEPMDIDIYAREKYYFNYKNPAFTKVNADAERTTDDAARAKLYGDAQKILADDVPALYLFVLPKLGVWNAKLEGLWKNEPIPSNDLTEVRWVSDLYETVMAARPSERRHCVPKRDAPASSAAA